MRHQPSEQTNKKRPEGPIPNSYRAFLSNQPTNVMRQSEVTFGLVVVQDGLEFDHAKG